MANVITTQDTGIMLRLIAQRDRRDWSQLPASFELDAVRAAYQDIKPHFAKTAIRQRVGASKAITFSDLRNAIS